MLSKAWFRKSNASILNALLVACFLLLMVFPDVIFKGASLRMTDQFVSSYYGGKLRPFYPTPKHTQWWESYSDTGGAVFQSEPMSEFMRRTIGNGDSPYWNPYSAAGSLGPETLVDQKFSPLTLITAFLGGSSLTYNITVLILYGLGVAFLYLSMSQILQLSQLASVGVCIFYLLNGYSMANVGSNIAQNYLFVPMCLYAVLSYCLAPNVIRFISLVLCFAVMLTCTFLPTTVISIISIYIIALGLLLSRVKEGILSAKDVIYSVVTQLIAGICAVLLLALLYFPIFENIESTGLLNRYAQRIFYPIGFPGALSSLFSSSLFFESYNSVDVSDRMKITLNTVYHFGVIAIALAGCSLSLKSGRFRPLVITCGIGILLVFGRLFAVPMISKMVEIIPIIGNIGNQYWWMAVVLPLTVLVGFGIHNLQLACARIAPSIFLILVGIGSALYINEIYGLHEPHLYFKKIVLISMILLTIFVLAIILSIRFSKQKWIYSLGAVLLVTGLFVELIADAKAVRFERNDFFIDAPLPIQILKRESGLYRTLNIGAPGLYPETGSAFGIQEVTSMNEGGLPLYKDYFYSTFNLEPSQLFANSKTFPTLLTMRDEPTNNHIDWEKVDLLGIKYLIMPSNYLNYRKLFVDQGLPIIHESSLAIIFENPTVLPRAFGIDFDSSENNTNIKLPENFASKVNSFDITHYSNARVKIEGNTPKEMLVVLTDNWHSNWTATVNREPASVYKVNSTFRGILVPSGKFLIEMAYQPRSLRMAYFSTGFFCIILFSMFLCRRRLDRLIKSKWPIWVAVEK